MRINLLIMFTLGVGCLQAQSLQFISKVAVKSTVAISIDKKNMIYLADIQGNINRYDAQGALQQTFSPSRTGSISSLEAWSSLRIWVFYEEYQDYLILDRFLNQTSAYDFEDSPIGFAKAMTPAADNNFWIFDNTDFSLKKFDPTTKNNLLVTSLDLLLDPVTHEINFMREYQNQLFVNDKSQGILLFDNLGNYKKKLNYPGLDYLGVYEDEIYFLNGTRLYFYDIYKDRERVVNLSLEQPWLYAGALGEYIFTISEDYLYFFKEI